MKTLKLILLLAVIATFAACSNFVSKTDNSEKIDKPKDEQKSIIAAYTSFKWDKFYYYTFTTESGKEYVFKEMPNNVDYKFVYQDAERPGGIEEPELLGKKFNIQFHSPKDNVDTNHVVIDYFIIDKIKMIDN